MSSSPAPSRTTRPGSSSAAGRSRSRTSASFRSRTERRPEVSTVYTSGTWKPSPGREEAFVEAWEQFAAWASQLPGAGQLRLTRDLHEEGRYVSFGEWSSEDAVRGWKGSPEFKERMAQVLQYVGEVQSNGLGLVATAGVGAAAGAAAFPYRSVGLTELEGRG